MVTQALLDDEFAKQHGPITDQELNDLWATMPEQQKTQIATQQGIAPENMTMEMARPQLEQQIKGQWSNANGTKFIEDLKKSYQIENYVAQQYSTMFPEDIVVPVVTSTGTPTEPIQIGRPGQPGQPGQPGRPAPPPPGGGR
jgi:hypothetical protein